MATTLSMASGPLTAAKTAQDDTKAQEVIRRFAWATGAAAEATNQQLLDHAVQALAGYMVTVARRHRIEEAQAATIEETQNNVGF